MEEGWFEKRNAVQLLHTMFSMYEVVKIQHSKLVTELWIKMVLHNTKYKTLPKELMRTL